MVYKINYWHLSDNNPKLKSELIDNRIVVWNIKDSQKLFMNGYYGKPIGIPKPKLNEINVPLILDLMEGYYLLQKSIISIYKVKKKITETEMLEICRNEYHNFDKKFQVYNTTDSISSTGVVLAGRLATTVRKQFILAIPHGKDDVNYLALDWWKA